MSAQPHSGISKAYLARLSGLTRTSFTKLVGAPSESRRNEAFKRLAQQSLLTVVLAGMVVVALMIWLDAWEIAQMPPRHAPSLWPVRILTEFGKDSYVLLVVVVMFALALSIGSALHDSLQHQVIRIVVRLQFLFLAVAVPLAAGELLKWVAGRGRPFVGGKADPFNFVPFHGTEAYASLPSAHAITAFALAFAVAAAWPRMRGVMIAYALMIAATRLVLLAHHSSDVVAGAAIAIIGALCVRYWFAARGLGFVIGEGGIISPAVERPAKGVAGGTLAT